MGNTQEGGGAVDFRPGGRQPAPGLGGGPPHKTHSRARPRRACNMTRRYQRRRDRFRVNLTKAAGL
ncbi:hypothetical protein DPM13_16345 [Paracoccus mutanolyticus]|uniref:Uncharacterized protein n=1 Tax=Paracoccus mutanolyticus TaxID=1499308 RepID=A0ABN5M7I9_9RHOB|nr:hypothetical protein DPM13_16345 [Paracoccus mutanolyticus]